MNCKPGDLAFIVRRPPQEPRALGAIVKVLKSMGTRSYTLCGLSANEQAWQCEGSSKFVCTSGVPQKRFVVPDAFLRPIRPGDLEDETPTEINQPEMVS